MKVKYPIIIKYLKKWIMLNMILLLAFACQNSDFDSATDINNETVRISFNASYSDVATRSTQSSYYENRIENIFLFVFDSHNGQRIDSKYYDFESLFGSEAEGNYDNGTLDINIPRGQSVKIYGIANIDNNIVSIYREDLEEIQNVQDLSNLKVSLSQRTVSRGSAFVMSGTIEDKFNNPVVLNAESLKAYTKHNLVFKRLDSKVFFHVETLNDATFAPKYWKVKKVATKAYLTDSKSVSTDSRYYFDTEEYPFEDDGTGFSFYALENIQLPKKQVFDNEYYKREVQYKHPIYGSTKPGQNVQNGDFVYAPTQATYVEFAGELKYTDTDTNRPVVADVKYTVHLGYKHQDVNDYSLTRNTEYHYYISLQSATSIEVEVKTGFEEQPGAEGHITKGEQTITVDAHYSSQILKFNYNDINHITWYVKTPFANGYREDFQYKKGDSDWVLFRINRRNRDYYGQYDYYSKEMEDFPGSSIEKMHRPNASIQELLDFRSNKLMTANQLVQVLHFSKLYEEKDYYGNNYSHSYFDENNEIIITAFINEYYYHEHPITGNRDAKLWKMFVNQPDRIITFLNHTGFSPDGNSSVVSSILSIRQQAIQTIYNTSSADLETAWGTERIQETENLPFALRPLHSGVSDKTIKRYNSKSNGRKNQIEILKSERVTSWSSVINYRTNTLEYNYNAIKYACMQRNRDENGDGRIDNEEVKWYLSSIDQLTDLWIGENSMDQNAKLFHHQYAEKDAWYLSSTVTQSFMGKDLNTWYRSQYDFWDNPWVLWAKEGSSTGLMENIPNAETTQKYNYRCVRNLGMDNDKDASKEPQDFVQVERNSIIKLPYLDRKSIRSYTQSSELPLHNERDADNMPWTAFEVHTKVQYGGYNWPEMTQRIDRGQSPCPKGYRVPNQRELAIMVSRLKKDAKWSSDNHFSRTAYSMNPLGGTRYSFSVTSKGGLLYLINTENDRGSVRCVRDINYY